MLKIIKSDAVIEEKNPLMIKLPLTNDFDHEKVDFDSYDLTFFRKKALSEKENSDNYKKYYNSIKNIVAEKNDIIKEIPAEVKEETNNDESLFSDYEISLEEQLTLNNDEEKIKEKLQLAQQEYDYIIEKANKDAETLRMKLAAEISEAEVKKELARTIAVNTVSEAEGKAKKLIAETDKKAQDTLKSAYEEGLANGFTEGENKGHKEGYTKGFDEGKQIGFEEGFKEGVSIGFDQGKSDGIKSANEEMSDKISLATKKSKDILTNAELEKEKIVSDAEDTIAKVVMAVVEKVLNKHIAEDPFVILNIIKEAIQKVSDQPRVFISVSPENYDLVLSVQDELKKSLGTKQEITVVSDKTLGRADAIVGTGGGGDVDARLATQLSEIRKTIEMVIHQ